MIALIAGLVDGVLAEVDVPLELAAPELGEPPDVLMSSLPVLTPHLFQMAILSKSSDDSDDAFLINRCLFLRSLRACVLAAVTCFCASFIALRAAAMCSSMSMGALRLRFAAALGSTLGASL